MAEIKFIVDESVDFPVVRHLRSKGFDTASIAEVCPSLEDKIILKISFKDSRILITNDKDFGTLIFKEKLKSKGVILLRLWNQTSDAKIVCLDKLIDRYKHRLLGNFIVVTENKVRIREL